MKINSYKELIVWQKAMKLVTNVYQVSKLYPKEEVFGLTSQTRRSVISIPSNIAEGWTRQHSQEFLQFLNISLSSAAERETQVIAANNLGFLSAEEFKKISDQITEIMKMLNSMIGKLKVKTTRYTLTATR